MTVPTTDEDRAALPIGPTFGYELREIDGRTLKCPIMEPTVAFFVDDTVAMQWADADGNWALGRYASGRWFKRRK